MNKSASSFLSLMTISFFFKMILFACLINQRSPSLMSSLHYGSFCSKSFRYCNYVIIIICGIRVGIDPSVLHSATFCQPILLWDFVKRSCRDPDCWSSGNARNTPCEYKNIEYFCKNSNALTTSYVHFC